MREFSYPHCVISNDIVYVSIDKITCRPAFDTYLENVKINIDNNGVMDIYGDEIQFGVNFHKEKLSDMDGGEIQENYIKHYNGIKLFGVYLIKPYDYVPQGWYRYKERKQKRFILNKYKLEFM